MLIFSRVVVIIAQSVAIAIAIALVGAARSEETWPIKLEIYGWFVIGLFPYVIVGTIVGVVVSWPFWNAEAKKQDEISNSDKA